MMNRWTLFLISGFAAAIAMGPTSAAAIAAAPHPADPAHRARQLKDLRFGMFICWSFSTFSDKEWTKGIKDLSFFSPSGMETDQWARVAKEAGMGYILFLTKHHDGFCLWDTQTTDWKVTRSPLRKDVLAAVRKSCDDHGLKLALYFSEGDWTWPDMKDPEKKKDQLRELCTRYGPLEFFWMDHAQTDGGLSHAETAAFVKSLQPSCFVGFNHGAPAGDLRAGELGRPGRLDDVDAAGPYVRHGGGGTGRYLVAEFTMPIIGFARWFYTSPENDAACMFPEEIYNLYLGAAKYGNIFSLDVAPDRSGRLRDIDVKTLHQVGQMIRRKAPPQQSLTVGKPARASSTWPDPGFEPDKAFDNDPTTRWGAAKGTRSGSLEVNLGKPTTFSRILIDEGRWKRVRKFELQCRDGDHWRTFYHGTRIETLRLRMNPITSNAFRLNILDATEVPTIYEFQLYP